MLAFKHRATSPFENVENTGSCPSDSWQPAEALACQAGQHRLCNRFISASISMVHEHTSSELNEQTQALSQSGMLSSQLEAADGDGQGHSWYC